MAAKTFHLGLCMAGSVSAGAYTAGVMDYLIEALTNWEHAKKTDPAVPQHEVKIDLLCGASGGGITAALSLFALHDKIDHPVLHADGSYTAPVKNIFWETWVEMTGADMFSELMKTSDIRQGYVPSALNASFIDQLASRFNDYVNHLAASGGTKPIFLGKEPELFLTLFNVTGINYELHAKSSGPDSKQYVTDHRDLAHFRFSGDQYKEDGRMHLSLGNLSYLPVLIQAAMATGAFPVGLKARTVSRENRFIWDHPFFNRGRQFTAETIGLGANAIKTGVYTSLNADGGTANNEPVELAKEVLLTILANVYKQVNLPVPYESMDKENKQDALKQLHNTSIILIDPFPSTNNNIVTPGPESDGLVEYLPDLIHALQSQLIFDAKEALDAYRKGNYGLHVVAPSRDGVVPSHAIACGALNGFGGFINKEFRVHDYFLGRHNCQSFLRKYFIVDPEEVPTSNDYQCVESVILAYKHNAAAMNRFAFRDENNKLWVPIIPDVSLHEPMQMEMVEGKPSYKAPGELPTYTLNPLPEGHLFQFRNGIAERYAALLGNILKKQPWYVDLFIWLARKVSSKKVNAHLLEKIECDLKKRGLIESDRPCL